MTIYETAEKPVEQIKSSQAFLTWAGITVASVMSFVAYFAAFTWLPENAANGFVTYVVPAILVTGGGVSLTGGVGTSIRGLWLTKDRIEKNKATAMNEPYLDMDNPPSSSVDAVLPPTRREYAESEPTDPDAPVKTDPLSKTYRKSTQ